MAKKEEAQSTEVVAWQEALAADAKAVAHNEGTDSSAIKLKHGRMIYRDQPIPDDQINVIVIASTTERCYYDKPFDPDVIQSPTCFAQSTEARGLVPHENVLEPQAESCDGCPMAEFGSAKQGKGPACKTYRKLAMIPADTQAADMEKAEIAYMKISPTSVKHWSKYAQSLVASAGIPPWAATTKVGIKPHPKFQWEITFDAIAPIEDQELLGAIHGKVPQGEAILMQPYTYEEEEADSAAY